MTVSPLVDSMAAYAERRFNEGMEAGKQQATASVYMPRIPAIKAIRTLTNFSLRETLIFIADQFGFHASSGDGLGGWRAFIQWQDENQVNLESVQGPHAITILKAIAAKHGRSNVSVQPSDE